MNGNVVCKYENGHYNILNLISVSLHPGFQWSHEELDDENSSGVNFYAFDDTDHENVLAFVSVVDVSKDDSEPDLSSLTPQNEKLIIDDLKKEIVNELAKNSAEVIDWGLCFLWPLNMLYGLLVCYDVKHNGRILKNFSYRASVNGHKFVFFGTYDASMNDVLSNMIYGFFANTTLIVDGQILPPLSPIRSNKSPREVLATDFPDSDGDLPISGGWGYSPEDPCIIDKNSPAALPGIEFDATSIQRIFVKKRIHEEMIVFRTDNDRFAGIAWNLIHHEVLTKEGRACNRLTYEVTAFPNKDWEELKAERDGPNGYGGIQFDFEGHCKKRQERQVRLIREFWFDIASCETVTIFGITFPWMLCGLVRGGLTNYESTQPGLGFSVPYDDKDVSVTIYIYDNGLSDIPTDLNDYVVEDHLGAIFGEIMRSPSYLKVDHNATYRISRPSEAEDFLCGKFTVIDQEKEISDSYIYLTTFNGKFIKLRISMPSCSDSSEQANFIVSAFSEVLWPEKTIH